MGRCFSISYIAPIQISNFCFSVRESASIYSPVADPGILEGGGAGSPKSQL